MAGLYKLLYYNNYLRIAFSVILFQCLILCSISSIRYLMNSTTLSSAHTNDPADAKPHVAHDCLSVSVATDVDKPLAVTQKLAEAKELCQQQGLRFTAQREQIYRHILEATAPLGAYDILALMQQQRNELVSKHASTDQHADKPNQSKGKKSVAPPTVYRGLEFLLKAGFIHQLTSINAFVPCCHPRQPHLAAFLICEQCGQVQEYSNTALKTFVEQTKVTAGFVVHHSVFEMNGLCRQCHY